MDELYDTPYKSADRDGFLQYTRFKMEINTYRKKWLDNALGKLGREPDGRRSLEIGCKDGSFSKLLKDDGWTVVGIDPNETYGRLAREIHGIEIKRGYFDSVIFPEASFDLVVAFQLIEHIQNPGPFLSSIRDLLSKNGVLYLETPNLSCIQQRQLIKGHVIFYSQSTLTQLLEHSGLRVLAVAEHGPGMMTFDQLAVLAQPTDGKIGPWRRDHTFGEARTFLERALQDDFPYAALTLRNHLFRLARNIMGERRASALKRFYRNIRSSGRDRELAKAVLNNGSAEVANLPEPVREAFLYGFLNEGHLREIARLPDEFVQLKVLARIKVYHLTVKDARELVERELLELKGTVST
jgi:SAM-dependent methyltransferase